MQENRLLLREQKSHSIRRFTASRPMRSRRGGGDETGRRKRPLGLDIDANFLPAAARIMEACASGRTYVGGKARSRSKGGGSYFANLGSTEVANLCDATLPLDRLNSALSPCSTVQWRRTHFPRFHAANAIAMASKLRTGWRASEGRSRRVPPRRAPPPPLRESRRTGRSGERDHRRRRREDRGYLTYYAKTEEMRSRNCHARVTRVRFVRKTSLGSA